MKPQDVAEQTNFLSALLVTWLAYLWRLARRHVNATLARDGEGHVQLSTFVLQISVTQGIVLIPVERVFQQVALGQNVRQVRSVDL